MPLGRVLMLTSNFPRWAGDSTTPFILHLARDLQEVGWRIDILAPHAPGAAVRESLDGVHVERFRYLWPESAETVCYQGGALINLRRNRRNMLKLPPLVVSEWLAVSRLLMRGDYDLVHSHWILPQGFTAALAPKPRNTPHLITVHGADIFALKSPILGWLKRLALMRADAATVNSTATHDAVLKIAPKLKRIFAIPMGASNAIKSCPVAAAELRRRYRRDTGPMIVFVGRLVEEKGVGDLIRAISLLIDALPDITALIVGDGQDRPEMEQLAASLGIEDRITFVGWLAPEQVPTHLAAADIFVGPSRRSLEGWVEAQGIAFAEAMLAGLPVVATRSGGITDLVRHEQTGLLVSEAAPEEIAAAVRRLVATPSLARQLAESGNALAEREYTRRSSAEAFSSLYGQLLHRGRQI